MTQAAKTAPLDRPVFGRRDPDARGYFGAYGGRFVPETLVAPIEELAAGYYAARKDPAFCDELDRLLKHYVGKADAALRSSQPRSWQSRAGPFGPARCAGLPQTGGPDAHRRSQDQQRPRPGAACQAHGQAPRRRRNRRRPARRRHRDRVCALLGLECRVYMGTEDMRRQALNVVRMQLLGATVHGVDAGSRTLKDAINEAMRDWVSPMSTDTHYLPRLRPRPASLPADGARVPVGDWTRGARPDSRPGRTAARCRRRLRRGGSNAIGIFDGFLDDAGVRLIGVEAGGESIAPGRHAARFAGGSTGVLQGTRTFVLQDEAGNIELTHSISAGLDYAAVGPGARWLRELGRTEHAHISDAEALDGFKTLARLEGILPALESSHAIAYTMQLVPTLKPGSIVVVNLSGRGDEGRPEPSSIVESK